MAVRVAGLRLGRVAEEAADVGVALDVRLAREVEVAAVRLRFAGEGLLQVLVRLRALERGHVLLLPLERTNLDRGPAPGQSAHAPPPTGAGARPLPRIPCAPRRIDARRGRARRPATRKARARRGSSATPSAGSR